MTIKSDTFNRTRKVKCVKLNIAACSFSFNHIPEGIEIDITDEENEDGYFF